MANVLEVPLEGDGEVLTIDLDHDLPDDPAEICVLLENERSAPKYWLAFGSAYAAHGADSAASEVLRQGMAAPIISSDSEKAPFYAALAWLGIRRLRNVSRAQRPEIIAAASRDAAQALQLDKSLVSASLAQAVLSLARDNVDEAYLLFQHLLPSQPRVAAGHGLAALSPSTNMYAILGRAHVLYLRRNFKGALGAYQSLLRAKPDMRPDPRVGIGLCMWQLGDRARALTAWRRSLSLAETDADASASHALVGAALLDAALHQGHSQQNFEILFREAITHMQAAYKGSASISQACMPSLSIALYLLAKNELDRVLVLADQVVAHASIPGLHAEAQFFRGRVFHARGQLDLAAEAYHAAQEADKQHFGATIGRGIIELGLGSVEASFTLADAVAARPRSTIALLYAGISHAERASGDKKRIDTAIQYLERYLAALPESPAPEAFFMLAKLYQQLEVRPPVKALDYTEQGIAALIERGDEPTSLPAALHSNRGTLAYFCGKFDEARAAYGVALQCTDASEYSTTIQFNLARLDDASGHPDAARVGYKTVLAACPDYVDAEIRLAYLDAVLGEREQGDKAMKSLLSRHSGHAGVRSLYGWWLQRLCRQGHLAKDNDDEQRLHKHTLIKLDKHDTYALCAIGNIYLVNAREIRLQKAADAQRRDKNYFKAAEFFNKALQIDPHNAYAAQGVAIIFAETKRSHNALHIFARLRETIDDPCVFVNTGHCQMDLKEYGLAQESYHQALYRLPSGGDASILTLIGRAWYAKGATSRDLGALRAALANAREALALQSQNAALKFNVAFLQLQIADLVRKRTCEQRSLTEITDAIEGIEEAAVSLREIAKGSRPPFAAADLEKRALQCDESYKPGLQAVLEEQQKYEASLDSKLQASRRQREAEQAERDNELAAKAEQRRLAEAELAAERERLEREASEWAREREANMAAEAVSPKKSNSKGKTKTAKTGKKGRSGQVRGKSSNLSDEFIDDAPISYSDNSPHSGSDSERHVSEEEDYDMDERATSEPDADSHADNSPAHESSLRKRRAVVDDDDE